jgi:hypothetical protein
MADMAHAMENDIDLHGDFDAAHWAERFVARVRDNPAIATCEETMQTWFAGAITTGYDHAQAEATMAALDRRLRDDPRIPDDRTQRTPESTPHGR